ncbi:hypothetical protein SAMN05443667_101377 [Flavobacterium gillisiae]|uniref:Uncharacterized protein n=1 Tax=Flavobacterium gillisiae TaxID=150146 RepID=A0A1H3X4F7_9FLAO|nr:hypothetical protein [Flavobacterium gillisiae]SDZ94289.1 hypothetical protein SAMN05443667_101377 [Flavobacterium gillisiae]
MRFRKLHSNLIFSLIVIILSSNKVSCQTHSDIKLHNWFDNIIGKENLAINNGPLYSNPYRTIGKNDMYYISDSYRKGTVSYDGQMYYDVDLKYNVFEDKLLLNPYGAFKNIVIVLAQDKIASFTLNDAKFTKKETPQPILTEFTNGYYETDSIKVNFILFTKHHKNIRKKIDNNGLYYSFMEDNLFFIEYKNIPYKINGKKDLIKVFPNHSKQIKEYYLINRQILKSNKNQFMKNVMKQISTYISNDEK